MRTIAAVLMVCSACVAGAAEPLIADSELAPALSASGRADLARVRPAASWRITAAVDEPTGAIAGTATLAWRNDGSAPVPDLVLQTLPNSEPFHGASLRVADLRIDGTAVEAVPEAGGAAVRAVLPRPLAPGATLRAECRFTTTLSDAGGMHGLLSRTPAAWSVYAWHPEVALRRDGAWLAEPGQDFTDPTRTATAHVLVELTAAADLQVICGGSITSRVVEGTRARQTISAPFTRNLAMILGRGFTARERIVDGATVRSWHLDGHGHGAQRVLDACAGSLALFSRRFGPYPFAELDAVETPLGDDVGGMESSGLVMMDAKPYEAVRWMDEKSDASVLPIFLLLVAASHETGHQWWYGMVGNDPYAEPWLDESLTNWTGNYWMEQEGGPGAGNLAFGMCLAMDAGVAGPTQPMDRRVPDYASHDVYGSIIYGRGALFYQWLRKRMGEERFFAFLRAWCEERRWTQATAAEWRATLARFADAAVVDEAQARWLEGKGLTAADRHAGATAVIAPAVTPPASRP